MTVSFLSLVYVIIHWISLDLGPFVGANKNSKDVTLALINRTIEEIIKRYSKLMKIIKWVASLIKVSGVSALLKKVPGCLGCLVVKTHTIKPQCHGSFPAPEDCGISYHALSPHVSCLYLYFLPSNKGKHDKKEILTSNESKFPQCNLNTALITLSSK